MRVWKIYRVTGPTGKVYIGQTFKSVQDRWNRHCLPESNCWALKRAIDKYGREMFDVEHVASAITQADADIIERYLIIVHGSLTTDTGYNIVVGGQGNRKAVCRELGHPLDIPGAQTQSGHCRECLYLKTKEKRQDPVYVEKTRTYARERARTRYQDPDDTFRAQNLAAQKRTREKRKLKNPSTKPVMTAAEKQTHEKTLAKGRRDRFKAKRELAHAWSENT